jgi:hypothetical protein
MLSQVLAMLTGHQANKYLLIPAKMSKELAQE